jgi:hypothetical protein
MRALPRERRRRVLLVAGMTGGLLLILTLTALILRRAGTSSGRSHAAPPAAPPSSTSSTVGVTSAARQPATASPTSPASDVSYWDALPAVIPAVCAAYPRISGDAVNDATAYARMFVTELFTRDYRLSHRPQLIAWAQWEDSPLRSLNYPVNDWPKVLVDSLTDLTWDQALDTPIPADGPWLTLAAERGWQTVSDVKVSLDPIWEQYLATGSQLPDPLAAGRAVTATLILHATVSGRPTTSRFSVSLELQLGSALHHGGYAMAATNNYVISQVS